MQQVSLIQDAPPVEKAIPKKLHFITGLLPDFGGKPFSFVHYMAVRSALELNPGFTAFVYYQYEPSGPYWDLIKQDVTHVAVVAPDEVFGNRLDHFAHKADVLRLQILLREGGIYLDFDTICQKPFGPLLQDRVVMGIESMSTGLQQWHEVDNIGLCNALIIAPPDAEFLKLWFETYREFDQGHWNKHSVLIPAALAHAHPDLITVEPPERFFWPVCTPEGIHSLFADDCTFPDAVSFHLWETLSWNHIGLLDVAQVLGHDTTYNRIARRFLFADYKKLAEIPRGEIMKIHDKTEPQGRYKFSLVACARWETPYIVEWLNYHRAIGFDHVFLYCNDDDPAELYERTLPFTQGDHPFVSFRFYPDQGEQLGMYANFLKHDKDKTEWVGFLDIDEFIRLPGSVSVSEFIGQFDGIADCVLFNWIFFGPNGYKTPPALDTLSAYTLRQAAIHPFTKYIARSSFLTGAKLFDSSLGHGFWHCPVDKVERPMRAVNVLGEDMGDYYQDFPDKPAAFVNDPDRKERLLSTAMIHHYAFRSEQAFLERVRRGLRGAFAGQTMWRTLSEGSEFTSFLASINEVEDMSLATFWPNLLRQALSTNVTEPPERPVAEHAAPDVAIITREADVLEAARDAFERIYRDSNWGLGSGAGSSPESTRDYVKFLTGFMRANDIRSVVDFGCGDWQFSQYMDWSGINYRGIDITRQVIRENQSRFSAPNITFEVFQDIDLIPPCDLLICKDVFQHIPNEKISHYLSVFQNRAKFLLITNDIAPLHFLNTEITDGGWRSIRLDLPPFSYDAETLLEWDVGEGELATRKATFLLRGIDHGIESLISHGKRCVQSSVSIWSVKPTIEHDASGAVNGVVDGTYKFHTDIEDAPWWMVDLGKSYGISSVHIYNRIDQEGVSQRASRLKLEVGLEAGHLAEFFRKDDDEVFGGMDDHPLVWAPTIPVVGRFVRITLLKRDYLHLDQVMVYGEELNPALERLAAE